MAKHTNQLIHESSPYLLQHAHNPVNWYPWGEAALAKAKREDKPILVSIGYAACHWCHVMERESFEDEETADIMNSYFVNIKIDREERPDLDQIYMDAVQAMNGNGGWPLNVFLTPDKKPFYGGTYFPPSRIHNRASWQEVLSGIILAWRDRRDEVEEQAMQLVQHIRRAAEMGTGLTPLTDTSGENIFAREDIGGIFSQIMKSADRHWGGFGRAPKFPQSFIIRFLLQYHYFTGDENALQQARLSLDKMIQGGIYDQVGGGFARYSTDTEWLAPHFEKMTYDNALLINVLADAFQLTNDEAYSETIRHTISFMEREMMSPEGGFYAALDADSEGVEGKFYTWTKTEFDEVLGDDAALFSEYFDVTESGNWEHTNILWVKKRAEDFVEEKGISGADFNNKLQSVKERLQKRRERRVRPLTDDKCLLGWNALMNTALTKSYNALGDEKYLVLAERNMQFLFENLRSRATGEWRHTFKNGEAKFHAFLDDYAFLTEALIALHESTGNAGYLKQAADIMQNVIDHFSDENSPYFFYTPDTQEDVIVRRKDIYDGATPSANSVMVFNLFRLGLLLEKREWSEKAYRLIEASRDLIIRYPLSFGNWATIFIEQAAGIQEIVVIGKGALLKAREILHQYIPNKALQFAEVADPSMPMMRNKKPEERIVYYLCRDYSCKKPVYDLGELLQLIETEKQRL